MTLWHQVARSEAVQSIFLPFYPNVFVLTVCIYINAQVRECGPTVESCPSYGKVFEMRNTLFVMFMLLCVGVMPDACHRSLISFSF